MRIAVDPNLCRGTGDCVKSCPMDAITLQEGKAQIDLDRCDLDGICIAACPEHAIQFIED
ncbi:MAG: indolepyruvate ferredoxin oxidoreductase subunit alpha [Desulfuromonadales bacterium]|uniref:indolepyruvate ferredoxin oxidoreductase subunit alpha n=1 Tax=Desulfuromonas sp. KJ2020 TaxID=2919173 RepID=UPI0020A6EFF4|nr:4Fe-4S binding protein [Desulfuromonas sp. KJ2020]MCP3175712.1 4Fe-4S binding protein [Desulfuromonas sp. KJ2020]